MTAWYVLSALGIYPVNPADGNWVLGSPLFPEATVELGGGRTFTIRAPGVSDGNALRSISPPERRASGPHLSHATKKSPVAGSWNWRWVPSPPPGEPPGKPGPRVSPTGD